MEQKNLEQEDFLVSPNIDEINLLVDFINQKRVLIQTHINPQIVADMHEMFNMMNLHGIELSWDNVSTIWFRSRVLADINGIIASQDIWRSELEDAIDYVFLKKK
jgi:hypothetical protein